MNTIPLMSVVTESEDQRRLRRKPAGGKQTPEHQTLPEFGDRKLKDRKDREEASSFQTQTHGSEQITEITISDPSDYLTTSRSGS